MIHGTTSDIGIVHNYAIRKVWQRDPINEGSVFMESNLFIPWRPGLI